MNYDDSPFHAPQTSSLSVQGESDAPSGWYGFFDAAPLLCTDALNACEDNWNAYVYVCILNIYMSSTQSRAINYPTEQSLWGNTRAGGNKNEQESPKGEQKQNSEQRKSQEMSKKRKASI